VGRRIEIRTAVTVDRPADQVFDYLVDVTRHSEWSPKPYRAEGVTAPLAPGSTFTSVGWVPGDKEHENQVEVTAVDRPSRFAFAAKEKGEQFVNTFTLTPQGSGTTVERRIDMPRPGGVLGAVFPLVAKGFVQPAVGKGLKMFKTRVEAL
jgi:uncharacterized protein YndB with AHSA1/START domain